MEGRLVEIIDVEKILAEVSPLPEHVSADVIKESESNAVQSRHVLIVDDSAIARKTNSKVVESLGLRTVVLKTGRRRSIICWPCSMKVDPLKELLLVISDIEMPEMDGYTFTAEVQANPRLCHLHVILHTSLSGVFNEAMVRKVGANDFLAKFHPDELAKRVNVRIKELDG